MTRLVYGSDELALRVLMLRRMCVLTSLKCSLSNFVVRDATVVHHLIALSVIRGRTVDGAFWSPLSGDDGMFSPNFSVYAGWQQGFVKTSVMPRLYRLVQHRQQVVFRRSARAANRRVRRRVRLISRRELIKRCSIFRRSSCIDPLNGG